MTFQGLFRVFHNCVGHSLGAHVNDQKTMDNPEEGLDRFARASTVVAVGGKERGHLTSSGPLEV